MVKLKKMKKKKHEEQMKAMVKTLLLQDEAVGWEKNAYRHWHQPDSKIKEMTPKEQKG